MLLSKRICIFLIAGFLFPLFSSALAPLGIDPGPAQTVCPCDSAILGGAHTASGGTGPYVYIWSPGKMMKDSTVSNPHVKVCATTTFSLTVVDAVGGRQTATVTITVDNIVTVTAGSNASVCFGGSATLGAPGNPAPQAVTYQWAPATYLSCTNCPTPLA